MGCAKFFVLLIWSLNFFFYPGILVLIEDQLLLISYEMVKLKEEGSR
jgi:hypothetical protein